MQHDLVPLDLRPLLRRRELTVTQGIIWKEIPGYEGFYEVSACGLVRSIRRTTWPTTGVHAGKAVVIRGRVLRQRRDRYGYRSVVLFIDGRGARKRVHRLLLEAFVGPGDGLQACHLNGQPDDNRLENLYWGTASENQLDSVRHGTHHKARNASCPQGHPYADGNTSYTKSGHRRCLACLRARPMNPVSIDRKPCRCCRIDKQHHEFYRAAGYKDGLDSMCRECRRLHQNESRRRRKVAVS